MCSPGESLACKLTSSGLGNWLMVNSNHHNLAANFNRELERERERDVLLRPKVLMANLDCVVY